MKTSVIISLLLAINLGSMGQGKLIGAWQSKTEQGILTMTIVDNYMAAASYSLEKKEFFATHGAR
jgi:hypothetical protein